MEGAGRPTDLTDEVFAQIKKCVFLGMTLREMAEASEISEHTLYKWHAQNYANLRDKIEGWRRDSKLEQADYNIDKILKLDPADKDYTKPVADMSKFVKETLDKPYYSKRTENTGADGQPLTVNIIDFNNKDA